MILKVDYDPFRSILLGVLQARSEHATSKVCATLIRIILIFYVKNKKQMHFFRLKYIHLFKIYRIHSKSFIY